MLQIKKEGKYRICSTVLSIPNPSIFAIFTYSIHFRTPLHLAVYYGKLEASKYQLSKGLDINAKDCKGE